MNNVIRSLIQHSINLKNTIHSNIYMIIGCYGIFAIIFVCLATKWIFHAQLAPIFDHLLPPAWQNNGDINHILGTDNSGHDIFNYLLISYKTTLTLTLRTTCFVLVIGAVINYLLFFIPALRGLITILFRLVIAIPPLLSAIVIALVWNNQIDSILLIVGISYLPRFVHNVHSQIMQEWQKTYITAHRLDGISTPKILNGYIVPNIFPAYLTEVVALFSHIILALSVLTFLGFGDNLNLPDLGIMMYQMLTIMKTNYWAFVSAGLAIMVTVLFIHMFNLGVHMILTKRVEN